MTKAQEIIKFMEVAEGLKRELRHSWLSDNRRESVAEHVWSMSLLAMVLFNETETEVDQLKVLKMIIIHDLVEIYAGDMPSFEAAKGRQEEKEKLEQEALEKLLKHLTNKSTIKEFRDLWYEFEDKETDEAKFAQACDKAEAIMQHNAASIDSFAQGDFDVHPYYKNHLFDFDSFLRSFKDEIENQSIEKFESSDVMSKISDDHRKIWEEHKKKFNDK
jgi:putative hydrolase of HD superfamily